MMGHVGRFDEIRFTGEMEGDLWEQIGGKTIKRRLQEIDVTIQHRYRHTHIAR